MGCFRKQANMPRSGVEDTLSVLPMLAARSLVRPCSLREIFPEVAKSVRSPCRSPNVSAGIHGRWAFPQFEEIKNPPRGRVRSGGYPYRLGMVDGKVGIQCGHQLMHRHAVTVDLTAQDVQPFQTVGLGPLLQLADQVGTLQQIGGQGRCGCSRSPPPLRSGRRTRLARSAFRTPAWRCRPDRLPPHRRRRARRARQLPPAGGKRDTRWRQIASANGITDPLALRNGSLLSIPRMTS